MELRKILNADLSAVVAIHILAFPDSALTQLGGEAIRRYYSWYLNGPYKIFGIGAFDGIQMVGFAIAGVFQDSETVFLLKNSFFLILQLLTHLELLKHAVIRNRVNYSIQAIKRRIGKKQKSTEAIAAGGKFGILSIAVNPQAQGLGIGKLLIQEVELLASQNGFSSMRLTVHSDNRQAILFYEKNGWNKVSAADGAWNGIMVKNLGNKNG